MIARLKQLWSRGQEVQSAATLLMVTMLLSNILGVLRDAILANTNTLSELDTYYAAFRLPDFLFNLFILGAISAAFIPVFLDVKTKEGERAAWHLAQNLLHLALIVLLILGGILWLALPVLLPHFVPGFGPEKIARTIPLARILLLSPFAFAVSYILGGILNANKRFFAYALAPLVYNLSIIVGGFLSPKFGVEGVAWSVIAGAALHALVQLPTITALGYRYRFVFNLGDPHLRRILRLMLPRSVSLGMTQLVLTAFTRLGSTLPSGAVSIYTLMNNFQTTPTAIFAASIGTAIFPLLGQAQSDDDQGRFRTLLTSSLRGMFFFIIPSMALLWVLRAHLIRLFLALNHQTWTDTIRAIETLGWFTLSLAAQGFVLLMIRAFYARHDTRRPMYTAIAGGLLAIALASIFASLYGDVPALSLGYALASFTEAAILLILFQRTYPGLIDLRAVSQTLGVATGLAALAAVLSRLSLGMVSEGLFLPLPGLGTERVIPLAIALVVGGLVGTLSYLGLALLLRRDELLWIWPGRATAKVLLPESEAIARPEGLA